MYDRQPWFTENGIASLMTYLVEILDTHLDGRTRAASTLLLGVSDDRNRWMEYEHESKVKSQFRKTRLSRIAMTSRGRTSAFIALDVRSCSGT